MPASVPTIPSPSLIPEGTYDARIIDFGDISDARPKNGDSMWKMPFKVKIDGVDKERFIFFFGYPSTLLTICAAKEFYIGRRVRVRVRHHDTGQIFESYDILWNDQNFDSP